MTFNKSKNTSACLKLMDKHLKLSQHRTLAVEVHQGLNICWSPLTAEMSTQVPVRLSCTGLYPIRWLLS